MFVIFFFCNLVFNETGHGHLRHNHTIPLSQILISSFILLLFLTLPSSPLHSSQPSPLPLFEHLCWTIKLTEADHAYLENIHQCNELLIWLQSNCDSCLRPHQSFLAILDIHAILATNELLNPVDDFANMKCFLVNNYLLYASFGPNNPCFDIIRNGTLTKHLKIFIKQHIRVTQMSG